MTKLVRHAMVEGNDWSLCQNDDGTFPPGQARLAVLLDIRGELKRLNRMLQGNFQMVPYLLQRIEKNTGKIEPQPRRKARRKR